MDEISINSTSTLGPYLILLLCKPGKLMKMTCLMQTYKWDLLSRMFINHVSFLFKPESLSNRLL